MEKEIEETPPPADLTQAMRVWAYKRNIRPVDLERSMGWSYNYAWGVLKGKLKFSNQAYGKFIHVYGLPALQEIYKIAKIEPKGTVNASN